MQLHTEIKQWGNSLALRVNAQLAKAANLENGSQVTIDVTDEGILIKPVATKAVQPLPFSEEELLSGLNAHTAHADEIAEISIENEWQ